MNFKITYDNGKASQDAIFIFKDVEELERLKVIPNKIDLIKRKFEDGKSDFFYFNEDDGLSIFAKLTDDLEKNRSLGNQTFSKLCELKHYKIAIHTTSESDVSATFLEGLFLSTYSFEKYKSKPKIEKFQFNLSAKEIDEKVVSELIIGIEATFLAKTWVNEPHSFLNAKQYSKELKTIGKEVGFSVKVLDKKKIEDLKMGGILAVNKGSVQEPTFNILEWKPKNAKNKKPLVLVGKGVMFDTGGLSLKPTANSMDFMKADMAGSAAVAATIFGVAKLKLPIHLIVLIPATDNRPGLDAIVPGDVITMYSGHSVEVLNTDAEGRLVLADALHYAKQFKPELVLDFATLTGSAAAALGTQGIVCMGTAKEKTKETLKESGNKVYERLVEFPLWKEYGKMIESDIADIKNLGGPYAGAITAGKFLEFFTEEKYPWMHFDIAGPSYLKSNDSYRGKNGSGVGVRLLLDFLKKY
jgi:leucyl aminopeptidase